MLGGPCEAGMDGQLRNGKKSGSNDENEMNPRGIYRGNNFAVRQTSEPVSIKISGKKHGLEEHEASHPNGRRTSKSRQNLFGRDRFYKKKQKGGAKDRGAVECAVRGQCVALERDD